MIRQIILGPRLAEEVCLLPLAVMPPAREGLLVTGIGLAPLPEPGGVTTSGAAVALAAIAVPANPELNLAVAAGSPTENR